jgi:ATP-dependent Clp protease protease subunit
MEFIISTYGGSADDMFALYDVMRMIQKDCEIHTFGLGKVMSAGVLLLAAGSKGKRKIGANCRVMIHSVIGGNHGSLHNLENEMDEIRNSQENYVNALVRETNLTKRTLKRLLERKVNVYLSATEAVEYGIADIIV